MKNCHFVDFPLRAVELNLLAVAREPFGLRVQLMGLREAPEHQRSARIRV